MNTPAAKLRRRPSGPLLGALAFWLFLLAGIFSEAYLFPSPDLGDDLTRNTVRLALLYYTAAVSLMIVIRPEDWARQGPRSRGARWFWTLAWIAYLIHLVMAFHHIHHWSHDAAIRHTSDVSGFGEGIYVSHLFTLLWTADVFFWWLKPAGYAARSPWIGRLLHGFMLFMIFNATIVFEAGWIRWAGVLLFSELAALWVYHKSKNTF